MTIVTCGVCAGQPLASGRQCVCGGVGTESAELQGIREQLVDLEIAIGFYPHIPRTVSKRYDEVMATLADQRGAP